MNEFPYEIGRLEEVAVELTEANYSHKGRLSGTPFLSFKRLDAGGEHVASVVHAKALGTERFYAILHDGTSATRILKKQVFLMKTRRTKSKLLDFVSLEAKGWTKEDEGSASASLLQTSKN